MPKPAKKIVAVDFEGVLVQKDADGVYQSPAPLVREFLATLKANDFNIVVVAPQYNAALNWLQIHGLKEYVNRVTFKPVGAKLKVTTGAVNFTGNFMETALAVVRLAEGW